ncbi:MAG: hypothetical protein KAY06_07650 [Aeromonadaceae bacterium]|nr:hypothetical protein [Aeromonadaceae bacterium]
MQQDAAWCQSYLASRQEMAPDQPLIWLGIEATETRVVTGTVAEYALVCLPIGHSQLGSWQPQHSPLTPFDLELAIALVEDTLMPLAATMQKDLPLLVSAPALGDFPEQLPCELVEQRFGELAARAEGDPLAPRGEQSIVYSLSLLILREWMHHLGFHSATLKVQ